MSNSSPWYPNYIPASEESFRTLHDKFIGPQDKYAAEYSFMGTSEKPYPCVVPPYTPRRTVIIPVTETTGTIPSDKLFRITIPELTFPSSSQAKKADAQGITNLRIEGSQENLSQVEWVELEIGGMRFDKVWSDVMGCFADTKGTLNFWHTAGGRVIPYLEHHHIGINIHTSGPIVDVEGFRLVFDVVPLKGYAEPCELPTIQHQFTGIEDSADNYNQKILESTGRYSYRLNFNHPMTEIHMRTENPVKDARLIIHDGEHEIPLQRGDDNIWSLVFSKGVGEALGDLTTTLNASRIDRLAIEVIPEEGTPPGKVWTWSKNFHLARAMAGMIGLAFTK